MEEEIDQATDERTFNNAITHLTIVERRLDVLMASLEAMKEEVDTDKVLIDGPILRVLPKIHDLVIKTYNTVQYLKETQ